MRILSYTLKAGVLRILLLIVPASCSQNRNNDNEKNYQTVSADSLEPGTFAYDLHFLQNYYQDLIVLKREEAQVIVSPSLQGRVLTSTADGLNGESFGWLNYQLIKSGEILPQFNPVGGEDRFWLGPEGGQFSLYFKAGSSFEFENWSVPVDFDVTPFRLIDSGPTLAQFEQQMVLSNYSGTQFHLKVQRDVKLLSTEESVEILHAHLPENIKMVGMESKNTIINHGDNQWRKDTGLISIWILGMFNPTPTTIIMIPFQQGPADSNEAIVNDDYFGKVPADRLMVIDNVVCFKADGRMRGKIGLSPNRALPLAASYDFERNVLTLIHVSIPYGKNDYVNSKWELQYDPYSGDVINAYNDGPLDNGNQLGPFYELESSSPAVELGSQESITHYHRTFHFTGDQKQLVTLTKELLNVDLESIRQLFDN